MSEQLVTANPEKIEIPSAPAPERPKGAEQAVHEQVEQRFQAEAAVAVEAGRSERAALPVVDDRPHLLDNAVKQQRLQQNLTRIQTKLQPVERAFSRVVHQSDVAKFSSVAAKTVSRPSGMLGGSIAAFVGSLIYLYLARHIGFTYNYLLFMLLFVGGFALGIAGEYAIYWSKRFSSR